MYLPMAESKPIKKNAPSEIMLRDHSSITSSKRWVGRVRKWQFLMIYRTVNHQRGGEGNKNKIFSTQLGY